MHKKQPKREQNVIFSKIYSGSNYTKKRRKSHHYFSLHGGKAKKIIIIAHVWTLEFYLTRDRKLLHQTRLGSVTFNITWSLSYKTIVETCIIKKALVTATVIRCHVCIGNRWVSFQYYFQYTSFPQYRHKTVKIKSYLGPGN